MKKRQTFTDEEKKSLVQQYMELPTKLRLDWCKARRVGTSNLHRWKKEFGFPEFKFVPMPADGSVPIIEPKKTRKSSQAPATETGAPAKRPYMSKQRQLVADLLAENTLLKGLLQVASREGFIDRFLQINPLFRVDPPEEEDDA